MRSSQSEELLWEVRGAQADAAGPLPSDELLEDYRAGALSDIGARRLEWVLCRSAPARDRLAQLAGVELSQPPERSRAKVLGPPYGAEPSRTRIGQLAVAVFLAGAMISAAILLDADPHPTLPSGLAFDVRVEGFAASRSGGGLPQAYAETSVKIRVEPQRDGLHGLDFAVYAHRDGQLRRLRENEDGLRQELHRGAALLVVPAASLVGTSPGTREFFVVVAPLGTLPDQLAIEAVGSAALTGEALVYRETLTVLSPGEPSPSTIER